MPDTPEARSALPEHYARLGNLLHAATNVGDSNDERDLYWVLDETVRVAMDHHPPVLCKAGCSQCCYMPNAPVASSIEWQRLHRELVAMPLPQQAAIIAYTRKHFSAWLRALVLDPSRHGAVLTKEVNPLLETLPRDVHCPFLIEERCSVYAGRPLLCRGFGHFLHLGIGATQLLPFMCPEAIQHVMATFPPDNRLPIFVPYSQTMDTLKPPTSVNAPLPVWVAAHAEGDHFRATPIVAPDFRAAVTRFLDGPAGAGA